MIASELKATLKILKGHEVGKCFTLLAETTVLGRDSTCDIPLPLSTVSRRHAQIVRDAEGFYLEDLESLNGTFVDSRRIDGPRRLQGGEHIQIDDFLLSFRQQAVDHLDEAETESASDLKRSMSPIPEPPITSTVVKQLNVFSGLGLRPEVNAQVKLKAILDILRNVGTPLHIDEVLARILETLFHIFPQADRGYVFLSEGDPPRLLPRAAKQRVCEGDPSATIGPLSNRTALRVMTEGQPVLCSVSEEDGAGEQVLNDPVRGTMGAPLTTPTNVVIGVIQLNTEDAGHQFLDQDLELLASVGSLAGQLLDHARLIERNRQEAILAREHAATESERRWLRAMLDILPVGVFITDRQGGLLEANPEAEVIWGGPIPQWTRPEDFADHFRIWRPDSGQRLTSEEFGLTRALKRGEICRAEELEIETFDGRRRTILSYARPIRDEHENLLGGVAVNVDITSRKQTEKALGQASQRKDEFLAMLAHELRNPLAPLRSALALMGQQSLDAETLDWARRMMDQQVDHMVRLVDDLLDVSRIARGKFALRREPAEVSHVIESAIEAVRPLLESQEQHLEISLPADPLWLDLDGVRIAQVVTNLLNNSAKYTERGGRIRIEAAREGNELAIRVSDSGIGISAEMLPHVFDPFVQAEQSLDRAQGGLGIGLSLVRNIVEMHGGKVSVDSAGPRKGCRFTVRIPVVERPPPPASHPGAPWPIERRRVLVVDDQVGQAQILAKMLARFWGHEVALAHDGPAALEAARRQRPEVVLLDIGLPGMSGYEVARLLRAEGECQSSFLVALTGYGQDDDRRRSQEAGFDLHLVKPPSVAALQQVFSHPRLRHTNSPA